MGLETYLLAGAVTATVVGTVRQMRAARQGAKAQEAMAAYNAEVMTGEAAETRRASLEEQRIRRDRMRQVLKARRALYAKAKVRIEGSPMETQLATAEVLSEDIAALSRAYDIQARRAMSQAGLDIYRAKATKRVGRIGVGQALYGGISDIARLGLSYHLAKQ